MLQKDALDILKLGHNVFLTGPAGAGKTYVLNKFIAHLKKNNIKAGVTASTGIAATHINGMTIHSWCGIGIKDELTNKDLKSLRGKSSLKKRLGEAKVLIIDEVSMLHGSRLDLVDTVCRELKIKDKPFGGLQVVLCGDLFQLPPVTRNGPPDFIFNSNAWKSMRLHICYLEEQHRQEDQTLLEVLNAIRHNQVEEDHFETLKDRFKEPEDIVHTKLYTHNQNVDEINMAELKSITTKPKRFSMTFSGNKRAAESLGKNCLAPEILELKVGAKVMFVANNPAGRFANGTLGEVVSFNDDGLPRIKTKDSTITASMHTWKSQDGDKTIAEVFQLPLRLAWAITVHKSQGMSLDAAEVDLSRSFEPGMGYVALSRVRTLDGLYIKGINNTAMLVNHDVTKLDEKLRNRSHEAKQQLKNLKPKVLKDFHDRVASALQPEEQKMLGSYNLDLYEELRTWRATKAEEKSYPAYVVFNDDTLKFIAALLPKNKTELSNVKGIGEQKLTDYGSDIIKLVKPFLK